MIIRILSDKNYDGMLKAQFINNNDNYELRFNLDDWHSTSTNGLVGGDFIKFLDLDQPLTMIFDQEYEVTIEDARKIYKTLFEHGWS